MKLDVNKVLFCIIKMSLAILKNKFRDDCKHCTLKEMQTFFQVGPGQQMWPHSMTKLRSMKKEQLNQHVQQAVHLLNINQPVESKQTSSNTVQVSIPPLKLKEIKVAPPPVHPSQVKIKSTVPPKFKPQSYEPINFTPQIQSYNPQPQVQPQVAPDYNDYINALHIVDF